MTFHGRQSAVEAAQNVATARLLALSDEEGSIASEDPCRTEATVAQVNKRLLLSIQFNLVLKRIACR